MKNQTALRAFIITLLLLNGIPALIAGSSLIADPSGRSLKMDVGLLEFTPFQDFLVPGIILFALNGLGSIVTLIFLLRKKKYYPFAVTAQGVILTGWITFQVVMIRDSSWLQLMYGFAGLALLSAGMSLENIMLRNEKYRGLISLSRRETEPRH